MIEQGVNSTDVVVLGKDSCYDVELCRIGLPHLPIAQSVIHALKLSKQELTCNIALAPHLKEDGPLIYPAFKVVSVSTIIIDYKQIVRGKIRSTGVGHNLAQYLRTHHPKELRFQLAASIGAHEDYRGAFDIKKIHGWTLML